MTKSLSGWSSVGFLLDSPASKGVPPFSQAVTQGIIEASVSKSEAPFGVNGLSPTDNNHSLMRLPAQTHQERVYVPLSVEQVTLLLAIVKGDDIMSFDPSKRDVLQKIAAALLAASHTAGIAPFTMADPEPWERLSRAQQASSPSTVLNATTLEHFEHLLKVSWQLCDDNQLDTASGVLAGFLPMLLSLPKQEPETASLAASGLRLQSILVHHHLRLSEKVRICEQSVDYARQAKNANILATALRELVWAYKYQDQPDSLQKRLITFQELLDLGRQASPLVRSSIYSDYSVALAESGRFREAECYIGLALEAFPDDPRSDPAFALAGESMFILSYSGGLVCIHTGSISEAFSAFERYKQHSSGLVLPERMRLLIANGQSRAAILDNDADRYALLLEDVLIGSVRIRSQKRFDEALALFQEDMPTSWLQVNRIRQLAEQYGLKREPQKS